MSLKFSKEQQKYLQQISKSFGFTIEELRNALRGSFEATQDNHQIYVDEQG